MGIDLPALVWLVLLIGMMVILAISLFFINALAAQEKKQDRHKRLICPIIPFREELLLIEPAGEFETWAV